MYENIVLIEAQSVDEANHYASELGRMEQNLDDGLTIQDDPVIRIFTGIRKIITVSNPCPHDLDQDRHTTGTKITYSEFEVSDEETLFKLAQSENVNLLYIS